MTHVEIEPGICGLTADIVAEAGDNMDVTVTIKTGCKTINDMFAELGDTFDIFEVLGLRPGTRPLFEIAREGYPAIHAACPTLAGITKCIEAEAGMALPKDASIRFVDD